MPIYEYRCQACGLEKEFLQKLSDAPITECPSCGKAAMTKLVSAAGFQLKGTGWYATDFKNSGPKPAKSDGEKAGDGKSGEASGGDSKSEAAPACGAGACPACQ
jgi:putative FmdB family regulatory protein